MKSRYSTLTVICVAVALMSLIGSFGFPPASATIPAFPFSAAFSDDFQDPLSTYQNWQPTGNSYAISNGVLGLPAGPPNNYGSLATYGFWHHGVFAWNSTVPAMNGTALMGLYFFAGSQTPVPMVYFNYTTAGASRTLTATVGNSTGGCSPPNCLSQPVAAQPADVGHWMLYAVQWGTLPNQPAQPYFTFAYSRTVAGLLSQLSGNSPLVPTGQYAYLEVMAARLGFQYGGAVPGTLALDWALVGDTNVSPGGFTTLTESRTVTEHTSTQTVVFLQTSMTSTTQKFNSTRVVETFATVVIPVSITRMVTNSTTMSLTNTSTTVTTSTVRQQVGGVDAGLLAAIVTVAVVALFSFWCVKRMSGGVV